MKKEVISVLQPELKLWYLEPATDWEREALPLGNGFLGGMVFGGVETDRIQINEHSLWSGGPGADPSYDGGNCGSREEKREALQRVRRLLQNKANEFTRNHSAHYNQDKLVSEDYEPEDEEMRELLDKLIGDKESFGDYQSLGEILLTDLEVQDKAVSYSDYKRVLNLDKSRVEVEFQKEGAKFQREYFISYPDNILAIRLSSSQKGKLSYNVGFVSEHERIEIKAEKDTITIEGKPEDQTEAGLQFAGQIKLLSIGGEVSVRDNSIDISHADEILLLMSAGTNYQQCMDDSFQYFTGEAPILAVKQRIEAASKKSYQLLYDEHYRDYSAIFERVKLTFENVRTPEKSTDQLLTGYAGRGGNPNRTEEDRYLEILYYQYGRYLLISSSREGTLPASLQGIWAQGLQSPWNSDYHTNINLQMNYWIAGQGNMMECYLPYIDYINSQVPRGRRSAKHYYCKQDGSDVRGWVTHHENNIWGNTAPGVYYWGFYFPAAAAWLCQDIWECYQFHQDTEFLRKNFNIMLEAALFWVDNCWVDERDHSLVANPSYSPEHGPYSIGVACDQGIIWEIFDAVCKAGEILGMDIPELTELKEAKDKISGPQIGLAGQFMEWKDETSLDISGDNRHRHANHLYVLHPGSKIIPGRSEEDDLYADAMRQTLNTRGDGGTGWSKAWKINFWARLLDGNRAHKLLEELLKESTLTNLFDNHPPFQIDGNFGAAAGMTEMLVQSQGESIVILPALPKTWSSGAFDGIKARGNFELSVIWSDNRAKKIVVQSNSGKECRIKYPGLSQSVMIRTRDESRIEYHSIDRDIISFKTEKNEIYVIYCCE